DGAAAPAQGPRRATGLRRGPGRRAARVAEPRGLNGRPPGSTVYCRMFARTGCGVLAVLLLGASGATAQQGAVNFTRTGSGARAAGMANAFIGVSDDGT